jgi:hypothetical protein
VDRLVFRYAMPNDDGTYDLYQVVATEDEGLLLRENMGVGILRNWDIECGRNVLAMGLEAAVEYWCMQVGRSREGRIRAEVKRRSVVAKNVRVVIREEEGVK